MLARRAANRGDVAIMDDTERTEASEQQPSAQEAPRPPGRRGALRILVGAGGLAWAGALAVPAARFLVPAAGEGGGHERWIRVARLADLRPGEPRRLAVTGDLRAAFSVSAGQRLGSVWVVREGDRVRAFSASCPHLGCTVELRPDAPGFTCPCHASRFGAGGEVLEGPSPRALDPLAARVVEGFVEVDFRRFRPGGAERVEASA
jgi:menaquinol-cytochrome c reductase iron-sulfur subunit